MVINVAIWLPEMRHQLLIRQVPESLRSVPAIMAAALKALATSPSGTVAEFFELLHTVLSSPLHASALTMIENKLAAAGIIFLDMLIDTPRTELEALLAVAPAVPASWLATIERVAEFRFDKQRGDKSVPQILSSGADVGSRGGNREHKLKCPVHGVVPLGAWLRQKNELSTVPIFFQKVGLYKDVIQVHESTVFNGAAIVLSSNSTTIQILTNEILKVRL